MKYNIEEIREKFKDLFEHSLDLIYVNDLKGNFLDANNACFDIVGYTKDDIKNINFKTFLDKNQLLKAFKVLREVKKYGEQKEKTEFKLKGGK